MPTRFRRSSASCAAIRRGGHPSRRRTFDEDTAGLTSSESELGRSESRLALHGAFRSLTRREREVVVLRFYRDLTQQDIADRLGLSQAQVSRTLSTAFAKLRSALEEP